MPEEKKKIELKISGTGCATCAKTSDEGEGWQNPFNVV